MVSASRLIGVLAGGACCAWVYPIVNSMRAPRVIQVGPQTQ